MLAPGLPDRPRPSNEPGVFVWEYFLDHLHLDFETKSRVGLRKQGLDRYARHSSTKVLMLSWQLNDGKVGLWQPHLGPMPEGLYELILDPKVLKIAHNAAFERAIFEHVLKMPTPAEQWHCTMIMAASLALPMSLDQLVADALQLKNKYHKDKRGKALIQLFCYPSSTATWETHPKEWGEFCEYCIQDTVAEHKVYSILSRYTDNLDRLFKGWVIDQRINQRGLPVDYDFIDQALKLRDVSKAEYKEIMQELTGLENPNSTKQLLAWAAAEGYPFASLAKNRVQIAMKDFKDEISPLAHEVLQLRLDSNKTSLAKYEALRNASYARRLRNIFQYRGAGATGRWAGRILGQNMPRPWAPLEDWLAWVREMIADGDLQSLKDFFDKPMECLATSIRSAIRAPKGRKLVVADLSSIELCVAAWMSGSKFWLDVILSGKDPYKAFAEVWLGVPYDKVEKWMRKLAKPPALGCQYRLGPGEIKGEYPDTEKTGLLGYGANMGVDLTQEQCNEAVRIYREISPEIVQMWYDMENAAMKCVLTGEPQTVGPLAFDMKAPFLRLRLPSGRYLHYCRPRVGQVKLIGKEGKPYFKQSLSYERLHQTSNKWVRQFTHGGKTFEQATQAIAADLLEGGLHNAEDDGFECVLHFHDEIGAEVDVDDEYHTVAQLIACMTKRPTWAKTMPISAAGYENDFYKKD